MCASGFVVHVLFCHVLLIMRALGDGPAGIGWRPYRLISCYVALGAILVIRDLVLLFIWGPVHLSRVRIGRGATEWRLFGGYHMC